MRSSTTVLDLEDSSKTKSRGLGLGLEHSVLEHLPGHLSALHCILGANKLLNIQQLAGSSLMSPQSLSWSQTHRCEIQMPLSQRNSPALQVRAAATDPQCAGASSSPCRQLRRPSHTNDDGRHMRRCTPRFEGQSNVPAGHASVSVYKSTSHTSHSNQTPRVAYIEKLVLSISYIIRVYRQRHY